MKQLNIVARVYNHVRQHAKLRKRLKRRGLSWKVVARLCRRCSKANNQAVGLSNLFHNLYLDQTSTRVNMAQVWEAAYDHRNL